jgi:hypothetical protein
MSTLGRATVLAVFFAFLVAGLFLQGDGREVSSTSFGETPKGYRASYELLRRLDVPVARSLTDPSTVAAETLWLVDPPGLCGAGSRVLTSGDYEADGPLAGWVRRGGTLVVFLDSAAIDSCEPIAGLRLPPFEPPVCKEGAQQAGNERRRKSGTVGMTGRMAASARRLEARLHRFVTDPAWQVALDANGAPFVVEQALGDGRVVVVADAQVMNNRSLDRHDSSLFVVDLVREYGAPQVDEWMHGFRTHESLALFLARSPALAVFCGAALLASAIAWFGAVIPPRAVQARLRPPSLDDTIDALATAYAATADYPALHSRYRHYAAGRLRHHLGLPIDASLDLVSAALERRRRIPRERTRSLFDEPAAGDREQMLHQMQRLDQLIEEART